MADIQKYSEQTKNSAGTMFRVRQQPIRCIIR